MSLFVLGDTHLSFGVPDKPMDIFGPRWERHTERIYEQWTDTVRAEDTVVVDGDLSSADVRASVPLLRLTEEGGALRADGELQIQCLPAPTGPYDNSGI